jgi:hypothetical protein
MEIRLDYKKDIIVKDIVRTSYYIKNNAIHKEKLSILLDRLGADKNTTVENNVLILESEPQTRTIFARGSYPTAQAKFDYLIHVFQFLNYKEKCIYLGVANRSFSVFQSDKSLESLNDNVKLSFTDTKLNGLACLNHADDFQAFPSKEKLIDFLLKQWWGMHHENYTYFHAPEQKPFRELINGNNFLMNENHGVSPVILPKSSKLIRENYNNQHSRV